MTALLEPTDTAAGGDPAAPTTARAGGLALLVGGVAMLVGGGIYSAAGADLWAAVDDGQMAAYLTDAADAATTLQAGIAVWILGVVLLGVGGGIASHRGEAIPGRAARVVYPVGAAVAVVGFLCQAALVRLADRGGADLALADSLGFLGARVDDVATALLAGLGPLVLSITGRGRWVPTWLYGLGLVAGAAGLLLVVAMFLGTAGTLGFPVVPIGMAWTIAAGVVLLRRT